MTRLFDWFFPLNSSLKHNGSDSIVKFDSTITHGFWDPEAFECETSVLGEKRRPWLPRPPVGRGLNSQKP